MQRIESWQLRVAPPLQKVVRDRWRRDGPAASLYQSHCVFFASWATDPQVLKQLFFVPLVPYIFHIQNWKIHANSFKRKICSNSFLKSSQPWWFRKSPLYSTTGALGTDPKALHPNIKSTSAVFKITYYYLMLKEFFTLCAMLWESPLYHRNGFYI